MALTASGQISFSEINIELGQSSDAELSLSDAAQGNVDTINTNSSNTPDSSTPHSISEWYGYDHSASSGVDYSASAFQAEGPFPQPEDACQVVINPFSPTFYHDGPGALDIGVTVFTDSGGNNLAEPDFYGIGGKYFIVDPTGVIVAFERC